ncbi:unnamed protein product, partial [Mesorhabditis spiculigera]
MPGRYRLAGLAGYAVADNVFRDCFKAHPNIQMECVKPIERRSGISEAECGDLCGKWAPHCRSAQYDAYRSQCDLFDHPSPLDMPLGATDDRNRYFMLQRYKREIRAEAGTEKSDCVVVVVPSIGVTHYSVNVTCLREFGIPLTPSLDKKSQPPEQPVTHGPAKSPINENNFFEDEKPLASDKESSINSGPSRPLNSQTIAPIGKNSFAGTIEVVPMIPDCPNDEVPHVQIINGVLVDGKATIEIIVDKPETCVHICRTNTYLDGTRLSLLCRSAFYDWGSKKCSFYPDALNPNGYLNYIPNLMSLYMEKICIPTPSLSHGCDEALKRYPQHVLFGHASDITTATSQQNCIVQCLNAYRERGFTCRSLMHYSEFGMANCILNFHTSTTRSKYFMLELHISVDYIELPPCSYKTPIGLHEGKTSLKMHDSEMIREGLQSQLMNYPKTSSVQVNGDIKQQLKPKESNALVYALPPEFDPKRSLVELGPESDADLSKNNQKIPANEKWSDWSECDPLTSTKKRSRICDAATLCIPELKMEPCFFKSEFDRALPLWKAEQRRQDTINVSKSKLFMPARENTMPKLYFVF